MNKRFLSPFLVAALACSTAGATELRAPLPGQQGPLRYEFEKIAKNKIGFNFWSVGYQREADKAFLKHGTDTVPYTSLIFGKSEFKIAESFKDGIESSDYTQYRSPYLGSTTIAPRASYTERGMVVGASLVYPVWKNTGHLGLRASIPFRSVRVEKDDEMEHAATGSQSKVIKGGVRFVNPSLVQAAAVGGLHAIPAVGAADAVYTIAVPAPAPAIPLRINKTMSNISSYNLKYLNGIKILDGAGHVKSLFNDVKQGVQVLGADVGLVGNDNHKVGFILIRSADGKTTPSDRGGALLVNNWVGAGPGAAPGVDTMLAGNAETAESRVVYVDQTGQGVAVNTVSAAAAAADDDSTMTVAADWAHAGLLTARVFGAAGVYAPADIPENLWITTVHGLAGGPIDSSRTQVGIIDNALRPYTEDFSQFLATRGIEFQTYSETGIGDAALDLFYQHSFSDKWTGEIYTGLCVPTGASTKYVGNPYKTNLGNGGHFEIKLGGKLGWAMFKNIDVNADASYSFVLNATEHRMAAFENAKIKNLGPAADADVSWGYFKGDFDVTLYHPKTHDISTTLGYELYYKTEDKISYKDREMEGLLGKAWGTALGAKATDVDPGTQWIDNKSNLSNAVARKNTESIAHRGRIEGQYNFSKYLAMYVGGKYTFAGQNTPREGEAYGGFNVKF